MNHILTATRNRPWSRKLIAQAKHVLHWEQTPFAGIVSYLRWTIPIAVSFVGIAYILLEEVIFQEHSLSDTSVVRTVLVIGLAGPALVWLTLTWAARAAVAEEKAQKELAIRNAQASRRALHLQTASLVGQRASALLELDALLAQVVELILVKFGYYHVHVLLVDKETNELVLKQASGQSADLIKARGLRLRVGQDGITGWVAGFGQPLLANDVQQEPRYHLLELVPGTRSELAVPLRVGDQIIGVLDVQSNHLNAFDKEDVTVLQILGNQIGIAIENARLFQETKRRYEAMIALHETSLDMIAQLESGDLLGALLRRAVSLLNARASSLFLYDAQHERLSNIARYNTYNDLTGVTVRPGEGAIGTIVQTGEPLIVNDYENWTGKSPIFAGTPETRVIGVPLKWREQIMGGILVLNDSQARPFDQDDLWLLNMFTDLASIAIKNAELHSQIKDFNQRLESNIAARTIELYKAKEEIAEKAEQLKSLLAKTIHIQEEERARIARDMHDGVVQLIASARYEIQAARVVAAKTLLPAEEEKLLAARQVLEEAEGEIRRAIYDLHSPVLDAVGLVPALEQYASRFQLFAGITCDIRTGGVPYRLPPQTELTVFRMIEEALHNVASHADAKTALVVLDFAPELFCVTVQDDGVGFDYKRWIEERRHNHLGLLAMRERIESLGGTIQVYSKLEHGTRISFRLPISQI
ncbi:MAG: GAF domain-containing sensor histidine kinase [Chloroflexi bacterium]|nr:GAF domain-containing sensor histidine kinase [Chloroflexota bacterium]